MKRATILPLSQVPRAGVEAYLARRGNPAATIAWKYFDARFNRGRERGFVWIDGDDVRGFVGLIPFRLQVDDRTLETVWTCDWSVDDPQRSPGMGIRLLRTAIGESKHALTMGGNELTRSLLPRIAARTLEDAAVQFVLPLRLGHFLEKIDRRLAQRTRPLVALAKTPLGSVPLPRAMVRGSGATVSPGVPPSLAPLLAPSGAPGARPAYDLEYVDWQCGRCPEIDAWSVTSPDGGDARAGGVVLQPLRVRAHWRLAWWMEPGAERAAADVLRAAVRLARRRAARSLTVMVARRDTAKIAILRQLGFAQLRGSEPVFVSASDPRDADLSHLQELSYLDSDGAHMA